jgi:hypothetical protein
MNKISTGLIFIFVLEMTDSSAIDGYLSQGKREEAMPVTVYFTYLPQTDQLMTLIE